ncbi:MAG: DUF4149 domain-containing protein [Polyangiaceae bacterium]|nr:DUF4149 domain-containing protein [Polyangiaceae bacterium]
MSETFSEKDLEPSADDIRRARSSIIDRVAATVGILAAGLVVGGMVALGACAAPAVFALAPAPFSGNAMGAAFARFDKLAIAASCVALGAEVVRTYLTRRERPRISARLRRLAAIGLAGAATYMGMSISPTINDLHAVGARRGEGELGAQLEATHKKAEMLGRIEVVLGVALIALHIFTLRDWTREDPEDEEDAPAPLPPGPRD